MPTQDELVETFAKASGGLLFMSESDYPFTAFLWPNAAAEPLTHERLITLSGLGIPPETPVEEQTLDYFFRNAATDKDWHTQEDKQTVEQYRDLVQTLNAELTDIKVYRVGSVEIAVYIVGKTAAGDLAGLSTTVIET
ncbi:MAG: nuclease A inhibitor family protein [Rhizobacter sp.]|nr:nuclease A inhibitor family protein [Chlorobiales bacterium]